MKCVVALALALTAQAVDIDWKIPVAQPSVTVDKATDATITFKWNGFHSVFEVPCKAAMDSCDFTDAQEIAPQSNGGFAAWSSADLSKSEDNFEVETFQGDIFEIDKKNNGDLEIKDGIKETADFKEVDILTCQGYLHVIDKVLFYDDANGSDGALGKAVGVAAGAVALGAALL